MESTFLDIWRAGRWGLLEVILFSHSSVRDENASTSAFSVGVENFCESP